MTMPSDADTPNLESAELRLHPLSWLFELFNVLKQFIVPLLVLLVGGRGNQYELWGLAGIGIMVPVAVARYFTFRYRIGNDRVVIRSGLLHKTVRDIAFTRVQNVTLHQSLLHRLMDVAEVRLETGGGEKEEGRMRVLGFAAAQQLQRTIRSHETLPGTAMATDSGHDEDVLLQLSTRELIKHGLISNKGMLIVAAGFGGLMQMNWELPQRAMEQAGRWLWDHSGDLAQNSMVSYVMGAASLLLVAFVLLRIFSIVQALLHYHGFTLSGNQHRLSIQRGLLNRFNGSLPRTRIQAWTVRQGWLQRRFQRYGLSVDAAAGKTKSEALDSNWQLAPIADAESVTRIAEHVLPPGSWPIIEWNPLHPKAWQREFKKPALLLLPATALCVYAAGPYGLLLLLGIPWLYLKSKLWAKHAGYSFNGALFAVREGWIGKHWRFAETAKVQAAYVKQSPFDRRYGMASVFLDTVNAGNFEPPLAVRYLPVQEAQALQREISAIIAR